jgi:hypothetical protein
LRRGSRTSAIGKGGVQVIGVTAFFERINRHDQRWLRVANHVVQFPGLVSGVQSHPDGPKLGCGKKGDHRFGPWWRKQGDAIAFAYTPRTHSPCAFFYKSSEIAVRDALIFIGQGLAVRIMLCMLRYDVPPCPARDFYLMFDVAHCAIH